MKEASCGGRFLILSPLGFTAATLALGNQGLVLNRSSERLASCCPSPLGLMWCLHFTNLKACYPFHSARFLSSHALEIRVNKADA